MESCENESANVGMSVAVCVCIFVPKCEDVYINMIKLHVVCMSVYEYVYVCLSVRLCVLECDTTCYVCVCE